MVFTSTVNDKMYHKMFVIQQVISHLDTCLTTDDLMHITTIFEYFTS